MSAIFCIPNTQIIIVSYLISCLLLGLSLSAAQAATFVVDTTSDASLSTCEVNVANDCSLRGAISAANLTSIVDQVHFDIPQSDTGFQSATQHWRISVGSTALPAISEGVVIDGFTQAGATANINTPAKGGLNGVLKIEIVPGSTFGTQQNGLDTFSNNFSPPLRRFAVW